MEISYIEKNAGPIAATVVKLLKDNFGPSEKFIFDGQVVSAIRGKARRELDRDKYAKLQTRPKVMTLGLKKAKDTTIGEGVSPSLSRAISNSKNSAKVLSRNKGITEPIYSGGNTAANIHGVMRSENKVLNEDIKKRYGRTAQGFISRSKKT